MLDTMTFLPNVSTTWSTNNKVYNWFEPDYSPDGDVLARRRHSEV